MTKMPDIISLDDVRQILSDLPGPDLEAAAAAKAHEPKLTKPEGSLGRLEQLSAWVAAWQGRYPPRMQTPNAHVFAGNHGVVKQGVSAYPSDVTAQMVANFENGGAAVNQMCEALGVGLCVESMDLDNPVQDFTENPAMGDAECAAAIQFGMKVVDEASDVVCLGEMGIGNTTAASAICFALYGGNALSWAGPGTGLDKVGIGKKAEVLNIGIKNYKGHMQDGLDALRLFGGREMAAITGAVIGARLKQVPVLLDGFVSTASAAVLHSLNKRALDHCKVGHVSQEPGHKVLLEKLGKNAVLDQNMRLGEATGAVLAVSMLKAAIACHTGMATFGEAGVSAKGSD
ncbi:nicotinate-nucleotide--dimethylbenzimidazole phosphoribosyltransferase [Magnetovibrio sp. PR-2]|uniref:nicotinate-nucleotide--dimethylbenzimidazole phosphoribosyltransferase n=1 Tax=Magnetovibrio sp. PR-2 TaxID=3120356 RepID=UPI002FCE35C3